eukprot:667807-Pleurochrysis_carterae.AAC.1
MFTPSAHMFTAARVSTASARLRFSAARVSADSAPCRAATVSAATAVASVGVRQHVRVCLCVRLRVRACVRVRVRVCVRVRVQRSRRGRGRRRGRLRLWLRSVALANLASGACSHLRDEFGEMCIELCPQIDVHAREARDIVAAPRVVVAHIIIAMRDDELPVELVRRAHADARLAEQQQHALAPRRRVASVRETLKRRIGPSHQLFSPHHLV